MFVELHRWAVPVTVASGRVPAAADKIRWGQRTATKALCHSLYQGNIITHQHNYSGETFTPKNSHNAPIAHSIPTALQGEAAMAPRPLAADSKAPIQSGATVQAQGKAEVGAARVAQGRAYNAVDGSPLFVFPITPLFSIGLVEKKHCPPR